jgi:putative copper resistance protein D
LGQAEHLLYVITGFIFFTLLFGDAPIRWRLAMPARLLLILTSMVVDTFVGIALLSTTTAFDMTPHTGWGLSPLEDTQAGGGIMWVFGDALMVVLTIVLFIGWSHRPEHARVESRSWLEKARQQTLLAHTAEISSTNSAMPSETDPIGGHIDIDEDDASYHAYNAWLARLNGKQA